CDGQHGRPRADSAPAGRRDRCPRPPDPGRAHGDAGGRRPPVRLPGVGGGKLDDRSDDRAQRRLGHELRGVMEQRRLGETGPMVSVVGLGCNNFGMRVDEAATAKVVSAALDAGITHFDTAEMYGGGKSEEFLGHALGARRDEVVIATKYLPRPNDEPYTPGVL